MDAGQQLRIRIKRWMNSRSVCLVCSSLLLGAAPYGHANPDENSPAIIQGFLGSLSLDDQTGEWDEISDDDVEIEFPSSVPSGGVEAEYAYGGERVRWGINTGGSIAWKSSDTRFSGGFNGDTGGTIRIDIDNSLFLGELHIGGFVRGKLGQAVSIYGAAGPMMMYGKHEVEDEDEVVSPSGNGTVVLTASDDSDFAFGFYARAGIDFAFSPGQYVGIGVRYMQTELDFDKTVGKVDIEGPQVVITFSAAL